jgi:hypothetical protein
MLSGAAAFAPPWNSRSTNSFSSKREWCTKSPIRKAGCPNPEILSQSLIKFMDLNAQFTRKRSGVPRFDKSFEFTPKIVDNLFENKLPSFRACLRHKTYVIRAFIGTADDAAVFLGVNKRAILNWSHGLVSPHIETMKRIDLAYFYALDMLRMEMKDTAGDAKKGSRISKRRRRFLARRSALKQLLGNVGLTDKPVSAHHGVDEETKKEVEPATEVAASPAISGQL